MFTVDDLLETLGGNHTTKLVRDRVRETANVISEIDSLKKIFPDEKFSDTESVAYMASRMCHSYPKVNARGRMFMPKVIANSVASARDNLINIDHLISDNGITNDEKVIGHIKTAVFPWKETADLPKEPQPMYALSALYLRLPSVKRILEDQKQTKNRQWLTSMECGHDISKAGFWYEGEYIPIADAPEKMRECVKSHTVLPYRDKELAFCLGGMDGQVDYWGYAATESPADDDAEILSIASYAREISNKEGKKKKFFGLYFDTISVPEKTSEAANVAVDTRLNELASLAVIGKTEPAEDGHVHDVLSDGTILPFAGHMHCLGTFNITRGSKPSLTGRTDTHHTYMYASSDRCGPSETHVHLHMINIPLRGKSVGTSSNDDPLLSEVSSLSEEEMLNLQEIADSVARLEKSISTGKLTDPIVAEMQRELASLKGQVAQSSLDSAIKEAVKKEIANLEQAGTIVSKEKAEELVAAATKKANDDFEAQKREMELRQRRLDEVVALGVALDSTDYEPASGKPLRDYINSIAANDTGEALFKAELRTLNALKEVHLAKNPAPVEEKVDDKIGAEAANKGGAKKTGLFSIVGGGKPKEKESASASKGEGKFALFGN